MLLFLPFDFFLIIQLNSFGLPWNEGSRLLQCQDNCQRTEIRMEELF